MPVRLISSFGISEMTDAREAPDAEAMYEAIKKAEDEFLGHMHP